jgi:uncharacterized phage infection (PIP) family protein YhgE
MQRKIYTFKEIRKELVSLIANEDKRTQDILFYSLEENNFLIQILKMDLERLAACCNNQLKLSEADLSFVKIYDKSYTYSSSIQTLVDQGNALLFELNQQTSILEAKQRYETILQEAVAIKTDSGTLDEKDSRIKTLVPSEKVALEVMQSFDDTMALLKEANNKIEEKDKQIAREADEFKKVTQKKDNEISHQLTLIQSMSDVSSRLQSENNSLRQQLQQSQSAFQKLSKEYSELKKADVILTNQADKAEKTKSRSFFSKH